MQRAQSAMEYLMTYGWAILIIAVVLGALYSLGVFSNVSSIPNSCIPQPGFLCSNPVLSTNGIITFTVGQATSYNFASAQLYFVPSGGTLSQAAQIGLGAMATGQETTVQMQLPTGAPYPAAYNLGTTLTGHIYLSYIEQGNQQTTQIGTLTAKARSTYTIPQVTYTKVASSYTEGNGHSFHTFGVTTTGPNQFILVMGGSSAITKISDNSGQGLIWQERANTTINNVGFSYWYTTVPNAASFSINATMASSGYSIVMYTIFSSSNSSLKWSWDSNPSLPAVATPTGTTSATTGGSTTSSSDILLYMINNNGGAPTLSNSSFTQMQNNGGGMAVWGMFTNSVVTGGSATATYSPTTNSIFYFDAITVT